MFRAAIALILAVGIIGGIAFGVIRQVERGNEILHQQELDSLNKRIAQLEEKQEAPTPTPYYTPWPTATSRPVVYVTPRPTPIPTPVIDWDSRCQAVVDSALAKGKSGIYEKSESTFQDCIQSGIMSPDQCRGFLNDGAAGAILKMNAGLSSLKLWCIEHNGDMNGFKFE